MRIQLTYHLILLLLLLPLCAIVLPVALCVNSSGKVVYEKSVVIHALAVEEERGVGHVINITVTMLYPGDGLVYVAATPLPAGDQGLMFITSSQLALYIASVLAGRVPTNYTFLIRADPTLIAIGGPSGSAYITCAMYALLTNSTFRQDVTMTGMILPGGIVGPVGGVPAKIEAAAQKGFKIVLVPAINYIALDRRTLDYLTRHYHIKVVPVIDVRQAIYYFTGRKLILDNVTLSEIERSPLLQTILRELWSKVYKRVEDLDLEEIPGNYRSEVEKLISKAVREAYRGNYYTAASLAYQALIKYYIGYYSTKSLYDLERESDRIEKMLNYIEHKVSKFKPKLLTIDLIVGIYARIEDARKALKAFHDHVLAGEITSAISDLGFARARAETLYDWLEVLKILDRKCKVVIDETIIRSIARMYVQYLKALAGYLQNIGIQVILPEISQLEELYNEGQYIKVLGLAFRYIDSLTSNIISEFLRESVESIILAKLQDLVNTLKNVRKAALSELYRLHVVNMTSLFGYMYIEFGDHYLEQLVKDTDPVSAERDAAHAISLYISSLLHTMLLRALFIYEARLYGLENLTKMLQVPQESTVNVSTITNIEINWSEVFNSPVSIKEGNMIAYIAMIIAALVMLIVLTFVKTRVTMG